MTKYTDRGLSYPEGVDRAAVAADVKALAVTATQALTDVEDGFAGVTADVSQLTEEAQRKQNADPAEVDWADATGGVVFEGDDAATFLTWRADGSPANFATDLIGGRLDARGWLTGTGGGGGDVGGSGGVPVGATAGRDGDVAVIYGTHGHPRVRQALDGPLLELADQPAVSIGHPWLFFDAAGDLWLTYSTDHAPFDESGTYAARFTDGPLSPLAAAPTRVYLSQHTGAQHETPAIVWDERAGEYLQLFSKGSHGGMSQSTYLATAPAVTGPWTEVGRVAQVTDRLVEAGNGHTGYLYPFRLGGRWYGHGLYGGTGHSRRGFWYGSTDWRTWRADPRRDGRQVAVIEQLDFFSTGMRGQLEHPFVYNGSAWCFMPTKPTTVGGIDVNEYYQLPVMLGADLHSVAGLPVEDWGYRAAAWDGPIIDHCSNVITWQGRAYRAYRTDDSTGRFGMLEVY